MKPLDTAPAGAAALERLLKDRDLLSVLRERRSRRFARGIETRHGPLAYRSRHLPQPLSEREEAALVWAAAGITGHAAADLVYAEGQGGAMMGGLVGRTVSSPDAVQGVALVVSNDDATYLIRRPADFSASQVDDLIELSRRGELLEIYRKTRVKLRDGRCKPPLEAPFNIDCNQWDLYAPGSSYFLPVNDYTFLYINVLLEIFTPTHGFFVVDERASFRPAGLRRFARRRGGHLHDDPAAERIVTVERLEGLVHSVLQIEQGMMLQNLGLMAEAMGLGGFPNFAGHEFAWFDALGFRGQAMGALRYLGAARWLRLLGRLSGRDRPLEFPVGLEVDGEVLLHSYCPPYYAGMKDAVMAVVERKWGSSGLYGKGCQSTAWQDGRLVGDSAPAPPDSTIAATIAYCTYLHRRYGRFPVYQAPYRTSVGFQAAHLDLDFYRRFYRPEILSEAQRRHQERWHGTEEVG